MWEIDTGGEDIQLEGLKVHQHEFNHVESARHVGETWKSETELKL